MQHAAALIVTALAAVLAACGQNPSTPHPPYAALAHAAAPRLPLRVAADLVVRRVQFGIIETLPGGAEKFVPAREIPPEDGQVFGWVVEVDTTRPSLHWQEHLQLPEAPADWGDAADDGDVLISKDGRSAAAQGDDLVEDGELTRFYWSLAPGDPAGEYELDVAVEGKPVGHFAYRVPAVVHEKAILVSNRTHAARAAHPATLRAHPRRPGAIVWR